MAEINEKDPLVPVIQENVSPSVSRKLRAVISDAYSFIRSEAVNRALATVTFETLMGEQIARNGESAKANSSQYNPYSHDPSKPAPEGVEPGKRVNFAGGSDTNRPTKIEMILALKNEIDAVVDQIKNLEMTEVADASEFTGEDEPDIEFTPEGPDQG